LRPLPAVTVNAPRSPVSSRKAARGMADTVVNGLPVTYWQSRQ
jgi:hypothetical protein